MTPEVKNDDTFSQLVEHIQYERNKSLLTPVRKNQSANISEQEGFSAMSRKTSKISGGIIGSSNNNLSVLHTPKSSRHQKYIFICGGSRPDATQLESVSEASVLAHNPVNASNIEDDISLP